MHDAHYSPKPLDTSGFEPTQDILKIADELSRHNHEVWARERIAQGWKFGPTRDDSKKEHPCLVPYAELPESEKQFNRYTALESVKALIALSDWSKDLRPESILADPAVLAQKAGQLIANFKKPSLTMAELRRLWLERMPSIWNRNVEVYRRAVDASLRLGEAFLAFDIAHEGLQTFRADLRLLQLQALALARTGATRRANEILQQLRSSGHQDEETLGILARTYKDFWQLSTDSAEKHRHLKTSFELYAEAYRRNCGYYSGINAAAMAFMSGQKQMAHALAREVATICLSNLKKETGPEEHYWLHSTLAESALIQGNLCSAEDYYRRAGEFSRQSWAVVHRTRAQARLLLEHSGYSTRHLDHCFPLPCIVVFAGHMFDRPDRKQPRFPYALELRIRSEIDQRLSALGAQVGFSSLACGADMLFAEAILERGGEINVVLPFGKEEFKKSSVEIITEAQSGKRFERILENAATVTILNERGACEGGAVYDYCNQTLVGLALLKGQFLGVDVVPLAVWDGRPGDGRGGTHNFVELWDNRGVQAQIIALDKIVAEEITPSPQAEITESNKDASAQTTAEDRQDTTTQEIRAMLFADIVGYTKLSEAQIPAFATQFLGRVARLMETIPEPPIAKNTWGDAMYCVFSNVRAAGHFALQLRALVRDTHWGCLGLPEDLTIRMALHAGPTYPCFDPVLQRLTFLGSHVNRTARIEPIAEEGQIYASQAFAALVAAQGVEDLVCDYVGQKQLAKSYGAFPVFLLRRAGG